MQEISFTIPVSGILRIDDGQVTFVINKMETSLNISIEAAPRRTFLEEGITLNDIALQAAREIVAEKGYNRFHASEVFHRAQQKYPDIRRNSFAARVIACTVDHPSSKHFGSRRDYFRYGGNGIFMLTEQYTPDSGGVSSPPLSNTYSSGYSKPNEETEK